MAGRFVTRAIDCGGVRIGGGAPISVQSMINVPTHDVQAVMEQIGALKEVGCAIVRLAVNHEKCLSALKTIREQCDLPLVADIHFDYRLAIAAAEAGMDKLRINPGNIGSHDRVKAVADCARAHGIPIRIGVNGASLEKRLLERYGSPTPEALCESALDEARALEGCGFGNIAVSIKSVSVMDTIEANRLFRKQTDYPIHLGVTHAGDYESALVKSAVGIGALLSEGIGDTLRVSITGDSVDEVRAGKAILAALRLYREGVEIISCPKCGRCDVDIERVAAEVKRRLAHIKAPLVAAVMGCVVNGPGEAREADVAICCGVGAGALYSRGVFVRKVPADGLAQALVQEVERLAGMDRTAS